MTPLSLIFTFLFFVLLNTSFISCSQNEDLIDLVGLEDPKDDPKEPEGDGTDGEGTDPDNDDGSDDGDTGSDFDSGEGLKISTTPCDFQLTEATSNSTIEIDCQMDLKGQTITLPTGVTLTFKGGEIINGTLNFLGQGIIDGNLLNKDLNVEGDVQLSGPEFQFYPERWDIVQGENVDSDRALKNNTNFEGLMYFVKELGADTFLVDEFDAYFEVTKVTSTNTNQNFYPTTEAVNVPSNFTLSMTDNTLLRVYPTENTDSATLLAIREVENVRVIGGVLIGDRDLRQYSRENAEEGAHLLTIRSGKNVVLDGIKFTKGSMGGLNINSEGHSFEPNYDPTHNVVVKSCVFDSNRRISIAITDGYDIEIDGNTFLNHGLPTAISDGGVVGYAINLEPVRTRDSATNDLLEYQKVYNVTIRNNTERRSRAGALVVYIGQNIIVENNDFENMVSISLTSDTQIRNNTFTASAESAKRPAIRAGGSGETVFNNKIANNTIEGYGLAIAAYYKDMEVSGNIINNCSTGIQFKEAEDILINDNRITNMNEGRGITGHLTTGKNVQIRNNEINVQKNSTYFVELNKGSSDATNVIVEGNNFLGSGSSVISNTSGVLYKGNNSKGGIETFNASYIEISDNSISPEARDGINLRGGSNNIVIKDNIIDVASRYDCVGNESTGSVSISNNTCQQ